MRSHQRQPAVNGCDGGGEIDGSEEEAEVARIDAHDDFLGLGLGAGTLTSESSSSPALVMVERNSSPLLGNADVMMRRRRRGHAAVTPS